MDRKTNLQSAKAKITNPVVVPRPLTATTNNRIKTGDKIVTPKPPVRTVKPSLPSQPTKPPVRTVKPSQPSQPKPTIKSGIPAMKHKELDKSKPTSTNNENARAVTPKKASSKPPTSKELPEMTPDIFYLTLKHISDPREIMKFRTVCSYSRSIIDDILPIKCANACDWNRYEGLRWSRMMSSVIGRTFKLPEHIDTFMSETDSAQVPLKNPFRTGTVKVYCSGSLPDWNCVIMWEKVSNLFSTFGEHISTCAYDANRGGVRMIQQIFKLLPKLKVLKLANVLMRQEIGDDEQLNPDLVWITEPFPELKHFESLSMPSCYHKPLLDAILNAYGNQLKCFEVAGYTLGSSSYLNPSTNSRPLPNLRKFKSSDIIQFNHSWITSPRWQLTHLALTTIHGTGPIFGSESYYDVMKLINNFKDTLQVLYMHFDNGVRIFYDAGYLKLRTIFPALKILGAPYNYCDYWGFQELVENCPALSTIDFLAWSVHGKFKEDPLILKQKIEINKNFKSFWKNKSLQGINILSDYTDDKLVHTVSRPAKSN